MSDDLDEQRRRLGVAQVEALFGSILIATATASATSLFIAAGLISLGYVALGTGLAWVVYLHALGICNLALRSSLPTIAASRRSLARLGDRVCSNQFRGRRWFWVGAGRIDDWQRRSRAGRASRHSLHGRGRHSSLQPLSSGLPVLPSADDRSLRGRELPVRRSAAPPTRPDIDVGLYRRNGRPGAEDKPVVCAIGRLKESRPRN